MPEAISRTVTAPNIDEWRAKLSDTLRQPPPRFDPAAEHHIGVFVGEGVGEEVVPVAVRLLDQLAAARSRTVKLHFGGAIGVPAKLESGRALSDEVKAEARAIFARGGALFCGPGGDRFVYELRREFDLYCKFTPLQPLAELRRAGVVRSSAVAKTDIVAVRENMGGLYQGEWDEQRDADGERVASQRVRTLETDGEHLVAVAARRASARPGAQQRVRKPGGAPSITQLWRDCAEPIARSFGVPLHELEIDNAVYQLIADPGQFDVIVSPNMFGDVLADCGSLLLASRGLSYSGNFNDSGNAVYQTGHGAARLIAGKDIANPIGQILSLGMMLRESFDWPEAEELLRRAVRATLADGVYTSDIAPPGEPAVGTAEYGDQVARRLGHLLDQSTD